MKDRGKRENFRFMHLLSSSLNSIMQEYKSNDEIALASTQFRILEENNLVDVQPTIKILFSLFPFSLFFLLHV